MLAGLALGYEGRDLQMKSNVKSLPETLILDVNPDGSYQMLTSDGRKFNTGFCPDKSGHVDHSLVRGNKLKEFRFKQRANCKEIYEDGLGYVAYFDHGVRSTYPIPTEVADAR